MNTERTQRSEKSGLWSVCPGPTFLCQEWHSPLKIVCAELYMPPASSTSTTETSSEPSPVLTFEKYAGKTKSAPVASPTRFSENGGNGTRSSLRIGLKYIVDAFWLITANATL